MTWTYTLDPANVPRDAVRLTIGDTDINFPLLQDEEINFYLGLYDDNVLQASADCCFALASKLSKEADYKIGPEMVKASQRAKAYMAKYEELRKKVLGFIATPLGAPTLNETTQPIFDIGMDDNRERGIYRGSAITSAFE